MYKIDIKLSQHDWHKENLVGRKSKRGVYDVMVCKNCGVKGRRYNFEYVEVSESYRHEKAKLCPKAEKPKIPKKIKVTMCIAFGYDFSNLLPDTEHEVVTPPFGYENNPYGVWVMGFANQPVRLVPGEFIELP